MKLIVGLGNPGQQYERTRHNLGFLIVDRLAAQNRIALAQEACGSIIGAGSCGGAETVLAKPQTFMNLSGWAVECLLKNFSGTAEDLVVLYDDSDLPFGRIQIRPRGSAGGHRGMLSIIERLAGAPFSRGPSGHWPAASRNRDDRLCFGTFQRPIIRTDWKRSSTALQRRS